MDPKPMVGRVLLVSVPVMVMGVALEVFLAPRHDYTGHFLAGYGGTLAACMVWFRMIWPGRFLEWSIWSVAPLCVVCIGLGAVTESTIFRLAKFDEIDFCSQSLGAVLAAACGLGYTPPVQPRGMDFDLALIAGIAFLGAGGWFAFA